jgi:hypothetical protein
VSLLEELEAVGITVTLEGAYLKVCPASRLTPGLRERLKAEKAELAAALKEREAAVAAEAEAEEAEAPWNWLEEYAGAPATRKTLRIENLPALRRRLEAQAWEVTQRAGYELDCKPAPLKRTKEQIALYARALSDPKVAEFVEHFDCEVASVTDLRKPREEK